MINFSELWEMSDYKSMICACQHADLNNYIIIVLVNNYIIYLLEEKFTGKEREEEEYIYIYIYVINILSPCCKVNHYLHSRIIIDIA